MSILPILTAAKILKALLRGGFIIVRQVGSHVQLKHPKNPRISVTVAKHSRDLTRKGLSGILKQAQLTTDAFLKLLR